ncbi:HGGxSTG domain-containing protein [Rhodospirillaceae bacterium SYSU D60014]|uniref:HGGxSTG domain-containing protein n=1 Tax=Virgifigura deserti TaxID=2268457 RepID=UPI000E66191E
MHASPRCGARTRGGLPCRAPAVRGKRRCRMHGGAESSGAPRHSQNALRHGFTTVEAKEERREIREMIWASRKMLEEMG